MKTKPSLNYCQVDWTTERPITFNDIWSQKPQREGANPKNKAEKAYNARIREGFVPEQMLAGVMRYARYCDARQLTNGRFVMQMATFLGPDCHFENDWKVIQAPRSIRDIPIEEQLSDRSWADPQYRIDGK